MSKKELTRLYRKKAKDLHPDTGGDHQTFVELSEAYEKLLLKVKG
jgi:curved DNA-binding protein CbpA